MVKHSEIPDRLLNACECAEGLDNAPNMSKGYFVDTSERVLRQIGEILEATYAGGSAPIKNPFEQVGINSSTKNVVFVFAGKSTSR